MDPDELLKILMACGKELNDEFCIILSTPDDTQKRDAATARAIKLTQGMMNYVRFWGGRPSKASAAYLLQTK